ncbi:TrmH family RNA methyltransferase [Amphibacillus sp. Q70]|uniref:TrmH family RNA methyltransferase n=1 Tax=Amphibacillus sp. Q70 TaxID=3453416 RepID=UPI003F86C32B
MKEMITSVKNQSIKNWAKLTQRKYRLEQGLFIIEGEHLVEEALTSDWEIETVIIEAGFEPPFDLSSQKIEFVSHNVLAHLAQTKSPQGILAIVKIKETGRYLTNRLLLLDSIQDPGNVGTMIRTADAAGFDAVILGDGTVDLYNDKLIRSSQGSIFHLPIVQSDLSTEITRLKNDGVVICASTLEQAVPINTIGSSDKMALMVGNEGSGIHSELLKQADVLAHIPIYGQAESLNVSVAAGIMMYHIQLSS